MADLLQIEEPARPPPAPPSWSAFLEMGFRPLYIAGCLWAAVAVALWVFAPQWLQGSLPAVLWHAHEMLWGFVATIAVGFLLTAVTNWTGRNPSQGPALAALVLLWLVARIGLLLPSNTAFLVGSAADVLFFALAAVATGRAIYGARSRRNYGVPLLLLALAVTNALFLWSIHLQADYGLLMHYYHTALLCMAAIALLVARRVTPFFATRVLRGIELNQHARSGQYQMGASVLAIACFALHWNAAAAVLLAAAGLIALWQWLDWKPWAVREVPLLWILYVGYAALGLGLLVTAAFAIGWIQRSAWPVHVLGVGGFAVLIIGMVTRTALGHLGRPLNTDRLMVLCYALVIAAALLRLLALWPTSASLAFLHASAGCWVAAFALYLWRFVPWLIRARADQPRGKPVVLQRKG